MKDFLKVIEEQAFRRRLKNYELAAAIGVSPSFLSQVRSGKKKPSGPLLLGLSRLASEPENHETPDTSLVLTLPDGTVCRIPVGNSPQSHAQAVSDAAEFVLRMGGKRCVNSGDT